MTDTYTDRLRFDQPQQNADANTWGGLLNTDLQLIDDSLSHLAFVDLTGHSAVTLSVGYGTEDESRCYGQRFTGTLTQTCTVTYPAVEKPGVAANLTAGNQDVILTTGIGGSVRTTALNGYFTPYYCDSSNMIAPRYSFQGGILVQSQFTVLDTIATFIGPRFGWSIVVNTVDGDNILLQYQGVFKGSITTSANGTFYNSASDYRLKTVHGPASAEPIDALKVYDAEWKATGHRYPMLLAHEAQEAGFGYCVHGEKDAEDQYGGILPQSVDYSKMVPQLVVSLQDARQRIATLEKIVDDLIDIIGRPEEAAR